MPLIKMEAVTEVTKNLEGRKNLWSEFFLMQKTNGESEETDDGSLQKKGKIGDVAVKNQSVKMISERRPNRGQSIPVLNHDTEENLGEKTRPVREQLQPHKVRQWS